MKRCTWSEKSEILKQYHDLEWGIPIKDDQLLFEFLILEGAQAGLSWETVLKKRKEYRKVFFNFDPQKVSKISEKEQALLMNNAGIIRNKLKIKSTIQNAKTFLEIQQEYGSFSNYIWGFVKNIPQIHEWNSIQEIPTSTPLSDTISKDLKKRGMNFVGTTIIYAYLQAIGIISDHETHCHFHPKNKKNR